MDLLATLGISRVAGLLVAGASRNEFAGLEA
jgi:hypothetical protein